MGDDDPIARLRAEMDQAKEGVKELPGLLWAFYSEGVAAGFSESQAFLLTRDYQNAMLGSLRGGDDE